MTNTRIILEKDIENMFCNWVEAQGGKVWKWEGSREKLDRVVLTHTGVLGLIEFKKPKTGRLSPQQIEIVDDINKINSKVVCVTDSFTKAIQWYLELS